MNRSIKMKSKNSSKSMILIFIGIVIFVTTPTYLNESPIIGIMAIIMGFIIGFIGFYHKFNNKQCKPKSISITNILELKQNTYNQSRKSKSELYDKLIMIN